MQGSAGQPPTPADISSARSGQRSGSAIPVIASLADESVSHQLADLAAGADGYSLPLVALQQAAAALLPSGPAPSSLPSQVRRVGILTIDCVIVTSEFDYARIMYEGTSVQHSHASWGFLLKVSPAMGTI